MILLSRDSDHSASSTVSVSFTAARKTRTSSANKQPRPPSSSSSPPRGGGQRSKRSSSSSRLTRTGSLRSIESSTSSTRSFESSTGSTRSIESSTGSTRSIESSSRRRKRAVVPPPPKKSVRFNETRNQYYGDKGRRWDQCHLTWYSDEEYDQFRTGIKDVLRRVMNTFVVVNNNSNPKPQTSNKNKNSSSNSSSSSNRRRKLFGSINKNNRKKITASKDKDDSTKQPPQRKRILALYKERIQTLVDITTDIDFVLDDATLLLDEPLEHILTQLYKNASNNDNDDECCWIGLEIYLFPLLGNESSRRRLSIQDAVQDIQVEYLQHGLWSPATVGSELRDSTRNYSQALTLLAQFLARATYHSAYHQEL